MTSLLVWDGIDGDLQICVALAISTERGRRLPQAEGNGEAFCNLPLCFNRVITLRTTPRWHHHHLWNFTPFTKSWTLFFAEMLMLKCWNANAMSVARNNWVNLKIRVRTCWWAVSERRWGDLANEELRALEQELGVKGLRGRTGDLVCKPRRKAIDTRAAAVALATRASPT